jgi:hypothetical protein
MNITLERCKVLIFILVLAILMTGGAAYAKDDKISPKEPGAYVKTSNGLKRLLPNVVFISEEGGVYYIESNNPPHFLLKDFEYFVLFGKYDFQYFTLNPLVPFRASPLGKLSFMFGKNADVDSKQIGTDLYTFKPKGLLGRGYYSLWINDTAWDFILD